MAEVLTATPSGPDPQHLTWTLCKVTPHECGTGTSASPYPTVEFPYNSGSGDVIVVINDPAKMGIQFAADPLWMKPGKGLKPTNPSVQSNGQITVTPSGNGSILILSNKNDNHGSQWFSYRLNFVDNTNHAATSIDPDWHNGGTGSHLTTLEVVGLGLSAATLAAVLYVAYQQSALQKWLSGARTETVKNIPG